MVLIDIESQVFSPIASAIRSEYPGASVTGEYVRAPSSFPHISIVEADNYSAVPFIDNGDCEKVASLMYEINVFSNRTNGKKSECRSIMALIDQMLHEMNFIRISMSPVPNMEDATIYRLTARYRVNTDGIWLYKQ